LPFCSKCGKELSPGADYCIYCGTKASVTWTSDRWREREWRRTRRYERREGDGWWGAVSAFGFLVIIGLTISNYPNVLSLINAYLVSWGAHGQPILPGRALGRVIIYFLTACGVWGLIIACMRFAFTNAISRPMRDVVGALFVLYVAGAFSQFYAGSITGSALVVAFFIGLAVMIIANAAIALFLPHQFGVRPRPV
jgi:hypothetical protein